VLWPPDPRRARRILVPSLPIHPPPPTSSNSIISENAQKNHATSTNKISTVGLCQTVRPFIHFILQKVAAASSRHPGAQLTHPSANTYTRNRIILKNAQKITQPRQINLYGIFVSDCPSFYTFHSLKSGCGFIQISLLLAVSSQFCNCN
jgi:hypothetical protein